MNATPATVCCSDLQCIVESFNSRLRLSVTLLLLSVARYCGVLQRVVVCCSVLQCVAVCY